MFDELSKNSNLELRSRPRKIQCVSQDEVRQRLQVRTGVNVEVKKIKIDAAVLAKTTRIFFAGDVEDVPLAIHSADVALPGVAVCHLREGGAGEWVGHLWGRADGEVITGDEVPAPLSQRRESDPRILYT